MFIITNSSGHPLHDLICVNECIMITCKILNDISYIAVKEYQWSIDGGNWKIGNDTYNMQVPQSTVNIACEVFVKLNSGIKACGRNSIIIQPSDSKTLDRDNIVPNVCIIIR